MTTHYGKFGNDTEFNEKIDTISKPYVVLNSNIPTYSSDDLEAVIFTSLKNGSKISFNSFVNLQISYDAVNWNEWDGSEITLNYKQKIYVKGSLNIDTGQFSRFSISGKVKISGELKALAEGITSDFYFGRLFMNCSGLVHAGDLKFFNHTNSNQGAYSEMFYHCTNLIVAPKSLEVTNDCASLMYQSMFEGCEKLKTVPELPLLDISSGNQTYRRMFKDCYNLEYTPELNIKNITTQYDYDEMFENCKSLKKITLMLESYTYANSVQNIFKNVAPNGTYIVSENASQNVLNLIPDGWKLKIEYKNYVDLGLPSGNLWCKYNLGATSEEERGDWYRWGELTPFNETSNWSNTPFNGGSSSFNQSAFDAVRSEVIDTTIESTYGILKNEYDVAYQLTGIANIPTQTDFRELSNNTNVIEITINEKPCIKFTSKINGNYIIIPKDHISSQGYEFIQMSSSSLSNSSGSGVLGFEQFGLSSSYGSYYVSFWVTERTMKTKIRPVIRNNT